MLHITKRHSILFFFQFRNMKSRLTINWKAAIFSQLLHHFIDEDTVSFDIFKLDEKKEKSVILNGSSTSSNESHLLQIDHQRNNQTNGTNNNSNLLPKSVQNKEKSFETFEEEIQSASNENIESYLEATTLKRYQNIYSCNLDVL